jgi:hypothetical protein
LTTEDSDRPPGFSTTKYTKYTKKNHGTGPGGPAGRLTRRAGRLFPFVYFLVQETVRPSGPILTILSWRTPILEAQAVLSPGTTDLVRFSQVDAKGCGLSAYLDLVKVMEPGRN